MGTQRKKIVGATCTLPKARASCVIVGLSPFPYLARPIARSLSDKIHFAHDGEPFATRFAVRDKTPGGTIRGRDVREKEIE